MPQPSVVLLTLVSVLRDLERGGRPLIHWEMPLKRQLPPGAVPSIPVGAGAGVQAAAFGNCYAHHTSLLAPLQQSQLNLQTSMPTTALLGEKLGNCNMLTLQ